MSISMASFGLREFADGDTTLFSGAIMDECSSQEDFEAEFNRLLTGDDGNTIVLNESNIESNNFDPVEFSLPTPQTPPKAKKFKNQQDFNPDRPRPSSDIVNIEIPSSVQFREDPLSSYLNKSPSNFVCTQPERKKRGRPPTVRFTEFKKRTDEPAANPVLSSTPKNYSGIQLRDRRSEDDFYSPIWIRGRGAEREGLCPICSPPIWFKIKQSAYWYHMNFFHGISASTGRPYKRPLSYRLSESASTGVKRVEGHCGHCLLWVLIASDYQNREIDKDSLNLTSWYKHAQKCHYRTREFHIPDQFNC